MGTMRLAAPAPPERLPAAKHPHPELPADEDEFADPPSGPPLASSEEDAPRLPELVDDPSPLEPDEGEPVEPSSGPPLSPEKDESRLSELIDASSVPASVGPASVGPASGGSAEVTCQKLKLNIEPPASAPSAGLVPVNTKYKSWTPMAPVTGAVRVAHACAPPVLLTGTVPATVPVTRSRCSSMFPPFPSEATLALKDVAPAPKSTPSTLR
jgi:hypothetical protein